MVTQNILLTLNADMYLVSAGFYDGAVGCGKPSLTHPAAVAVRDR